MKRRRRKRGDIFSDRHINFNKRKLLKNIMNWFVLVLIAAIFGYAIITFCVQTVTMIGPSMEHTLSDGQVVTVNKFVYKLHDVERYDVIAYSQVGTDTYFDIKRVIGLPGETVLIKEGIVYINGQSLTDIPINDNILNGGLASNEIALADDEYFVMGDNVNNSEDSRYTNVGNIGRSEILGRVEKVIRPKEDKGKVN